MIRNAFVVISFVCVYLAVFNCAFSYTALIYAGSALAVSFSVLVCRVTAGAVAPSSALVFALIAGTFVALAPSALMFVITAGAALALRSAPVCIVITRGTTAFPVTSFTLLPTVTT